MTYKFSSLGRIGLFLAILAAFCPSAVRAQGAGQTLYNGIVLPPLWPPQGGPTQAYQVPSYITNPPAVIPIDTGRQLFVDDFLIQSTTMTRTQHQPVMYPGNPIITPIATDTTGNAFPYSDGVWYDPSAQLFKMWFYCAGEIWCVTRIPLMERTGYDLRFQMLLSRTQTRCLKLLVGEIP